MDLNHEPPPPRAHWVREQVERHLAVVLDATDPTGRHLRLRRVSEDPEVWTLGHMGANPDDYARYAYSVPEDAAYRITLDTAGATVTKHVNGEQTDSRHTPPGEPFDIGWQ